MIKKKLSCANCNYFLATESHDKTISIKHRDLYITFEGGILREICPQCGTRNYVGTEEYAAQHTERVSNMKAPHDEVEAVYSDWVPRENFTKEKLK